jgi:hypothetical protein
MSDVAKTLDDIAGAMGTAAAALAPTGIPGIIASIGAIVLKSAAAFARAGKDPIVEIKRIHDADPMLKAVHDEWESVLKNKFPSRSEPPRAPDTLPAGAPLSDDPFEDG